MRSLLHRPILALFLTGMVNVLVWFGFSFWKMPWQPSVLALTGLALLSGWFTRENGWGTLLIMLTPVMFLGDGNHGRPWMWLLLGFRFPPLWIYFVINVGWVICLYSVLIFAGWRAAMASLNRSAAPPPR